MDYYASWPVWKMPKWIGVMLGSIFTVIVIGCAWNIVDLTRPPAPHLVAAAKVATTPPPAPAPAPSVAKPTVAAASADVTPAIAPPPAVKKSPPHKRTTLLAKHDAKSTRPKKDAIDRLLGL